MRDEKTRLEQLELFRHNDFAALVAQLSGVTDHKSDRLAGHLHCLVPALRDLAPTSDAQDHSILARLKAIELEDALNIARNEAVRPENRSRLLNSLHEVPGINLKAPSAEQHPETKREYAFMIAPLRLLST